MSLQLRWWTFILFLWWQAKVVEMLSMIVSTNAKKGGLKAMITAAVANAKAESSPREAKALDLRLFQELKKLQQAGDFKQLFEMAGAAEPNFAEMTIKEVSDRTQWKSSCLDYHDVATRQRNDKQWNSSTKASATGLEPGGAYYEANAWWTEGLARDATAMETLKKEAGKLAIHLIKEGIFDISGLRRRGAVNLGGGSQRASMKPELKAKSKPSRGEYDEVAARAAHESFEEGLRDLDALTHVVLMLGDQCSLAAPSALTSKLYGSLTPATEEDDDERDKGDDDDDEEEEDDEEEDEEEEDGPVDSQAGEVESETAARVAMMIDDIAADLEAAAPTELQASFVTICLQHYAKQGEGGHEQLSDLLLAVASSIGERSQSKLKWLKDGFLDKCVSPSNPYALPELPEGLVEGSDEYTDLCKRRDELAEKKREIDGRVEEARGKTHGLSDAEEAKLQEWREARGATAAGYAEEHAITQQAKEVAARVAWHERAIGSAEPKAKPAESAPPPASASSALKGSAAASAAAGSDAAASPAAASIEPGGFMDQVRGATR